jgi:hypothetical protein
MNVSHIVTPRPRPEEYSRVTNPERFRALHGHALEMFERLEAVYAVRRSVAFELLPRVMRAFEYARPPVTLTPVSPAAAPIAIAFTTFPSLVVRCGRWYARPFPSCGCDACAETAIGEADRLDRIIGKVVAGHFAESLQIPWFGAARLAHDFRGGQPGEWEGQQWTTVPRAVSQAIAGPKPRRVHWRPWPQRADGASAAAPAV